MVPISSIDGHPCIPRTHLVVGTAPSSGPRCWPRATSQAHRSRPWRCRMARTPTWCATGSSAEASTSPALRRWLQCKVLHEWRPHQRLLRPAPGSCRSRCPCAPRLLVTCLHRAERTFKTELLRTRRSWVPADGHNRSHREPKDRVATDRFTRYCGRKPTSRSRVQIPKAAARCLSMPKARRPSAAPDVEWAQPTPSSPSRRIEADIANTCETHCRRNQSSDVIGPTLDRCHVAHAATISRCSGIFVRKPCRSGRPGLTRHWPASSCMRDPATPRHAHRPRAPAPCDRSVRSPLGDCVPSNVPPLVKYANNPST